jgi:hypothetical protein
MGRYHECNNFHTGDQMAMYAVVEASEAGGLMTVAQVACPMAYEKISHSGLLTAYMRLTGGCQPDFVFVGSRPPADSNKPADSCPAASHKLSTSHCGLSIDKPRGMPLVWMQTASWLAVLGV